MAEFIDIKIVDDDIATDADGLPIMVSDLDSIEQDVRHMIRESGYLVAMIAERDQESRNLWLQKIEALIEDDERIIPGTVEIVLETKGFPSGVGRYLVTADTYQFGSLTTEVK